MRFFEATCGLVLCSTLLLPACSSDGKMSGEPSVAGTPGGAQTPATGLSEMTAWLKTGAYKQWTCEPHIHAARAPSPHGFNRICSNTVVSGSATGTADWPVGAAAVKELYASLGDGGGLDENAAAPTPVGYAVYLKTKADSAAGANWYWYEIVPADSEAPHDSAGIVANNFGVANTTAQSICVGCHGAAGTANHTPSMGSRDEVYTPVH